MSEPSVDVLAAQVRAGWNDGAVIKAIGALDALVARVTEAEQLLRRVARSPDPKWINEQVDSYFAARLDGSSE